MTRATGVDWRRPFPVEFQFFEATKSCPPDELAMRLTVGARHLFSQLSPAALENQTSIARQRIGEDWSALSEDVAACVAANRDAAQFIINLGEVCTADLLAILLT